MSYDVYLEVPAAQRIKPRHGEYPAAAFERLARIEACLRRLDPAIGIERDDGVLEADSAVLGSLIADPNRITLRFSASSGYSALLNAFHDALAACEPLGFEGFDPQVGGRIRHHADGPTFLRQFRSQILCPDDEFEQWIHGIEPPSWRQRRLARGDFERGYRAENFPALATLPQPQEIAALGDAALAGLLERVVAHNDAILDRFGLRTSLALFKDIGGTPRQRGDGSWMPFDLWLYGSSLGQEMGLHQELLRRGWPGAAGAAQDQARPEASAWPGGRRR